MLEVAVIGAGTSGLVAARHLISAGLRPTIFEAAKTIGGAWTPSSVLSPPTASTSNKNGYSGEHHPAAKMWNGMHTNLSKYTCRFSDWPWSDDASTFPSSEEMHAYLESYSDHYLSESSSCNFQLECRVFNVEQLGEEGEKIDAHRYKVEWTDLNTQTIHSRDFGGVVVATGFFHTPRWPAFLKQQFNSGETSEDSNVQSSIKRPQLVHSSEYKTHHAFQDKKVAVIGSSFSALELASDVYHSASRVVNVLPSVPWVLPRWVATMQKPLQQTTEDANDVLTILPADLALYQRTKPYPNDETTSMTSEDCQKRHEYLQSLVGLKQQNSTLGEPTNWDEPPFVAISDEYLDLVREDKIDVVHGRLVDIDDDGILKIANAQSDGVGDSAQPCSLDDIDHVICCTGYTPQLHDFLSSDILTTLGYDRDDGFSPMTLAWDTLHPSLPNLAFCGMYRGPYMGVMELQARLAAGVMSGSVSLEEGQIQSALDASQAIRNSSPRAQFPHFDYVGFIDTLSQLCSGGNYPKYNVNVGDAVVPTFYQPDDELSQSCESEIEKEVKLGQDGSRMPKIVLSSILGKWTYDRHIVHLQTRKVERVYGTVKYSKYWERSGSKGDGDGNADELFSVDTKENPVLYREDGLYELTPTQKFEVFREYEYEVKHDMLEIYFVEGGKRAHLFLSLKFVPESNDQDNDGYWVTATSDHLCIKDLYSGTFRVKLTGLTASEIIIKYRVKGPNKDYESTTILKPQS